MRKKNKILNLIVFVLICSFLAADLSQIASAREINKQVLAITKKDVKNGKVVVKNKKVKSIIIKKNVKKATIKLSNVKLSEEIVFEKGNYTLQSSKSKVTAIQIAEKNTQLKLDKKADLNSKNLVLKVKDAERLYH